MAIYQCSPPRLFSCTAARGPLARDAGSAWTPGIHRVRRCQELNAITLGWDTSNRAQRRLSPGRCSLAFTQPRSPASLSPLSGDLESAPSLPRLALYPAADLKHHLAARAVNRDPPCPGLAAGLRSPGDTCLEQRCSVCGKPFPKKCVQMCFPAGYSF